VVVVVLAWPRLATALCAGPPPQAATKKLRLASTDMTAARRFVNLAMVPVSRTWGNRGLTGEWRAAHQGPPRLTLLLRNRAHVSPHQ
jgi:hypothetical protein